MTFREHIEKTPWRVAVLGLGGCFTLSCITLLGDRFGHLGFFLPFAALNLAHRSDGQCPALRLQYHRDLVDFIDRENQANRFTHDNWRQLTSTIAARGNVTTNVDDEYGNLRRIVDPMGNPLAFEYAGQGNVVAAG
jgi:YD repeat-containing protein